MSMDQQSSLFCVSIIEEEKGFIGFGSHICFPDSLITSNQWPVLQNITIVNDASRVISEWCHHLRS
jgi:hypothetical protein